MIKYGLMIIIIKIMNDWILIIIYSKMTQNQIISPRSTMTHDKFNDEFY